MINKKSICIFTSQILLINFISKGGISKYLFCGLIVYINFLLILACKKRIKLNKEKLILFSPVFFYVIYGLVVVIFKENFSAFSLKSIIFYLSPICLALINNKIFKEEKLIDYQFAIIALFFLTTNISKFTVDNLMEAKEAFIFGVYLIYYSYNKKYKKATIAVFLLVLANKRIAISVTILILFLLYIIKRIKNKRLAVNNILISYTIFSYIYIFVIKNYYLSEIFYKFNINDMGRLNVYNMFSNDYSLNVSFLGNGIGYVMNKLSELGINKFNNLHNDLLLFYIEIGFIGTSIFYLLYIFLFNKMYKVNKNKYVLITLLFIYFFLICATDNVSIYISFLYPFYCIILCLIDKNK